MQEVWEVGQVRKVRKVLTTSQTSFTSRNFPNFVHLSPPAPSQSSCILCAMTSSLLLAYFLYHFTVNGHLPGTVVEQREQAQGVLDVEVISDSEPLSVAPGSQRVAMLTLHLRAHCKADVPISTISVQRRGMGSSEDIVGVYILSESRRLTNSFPIARRDGWVDLRLRSFVVPACQEREVIVAADFSPDAAPTGEHRFILYMPRNIDAGGATVTIEQTTRKVAVTRTVGPQVGTISVTYLPLLKRVTYGNGRDVMRFQLEADGYDDHLLRSVTFTNEGSAREMDLQQIFLTGTRGPVTDKASSLTGDTVQLTFDPPLLLEKNVKRIFLLRANVRASRRRTLSFVIEEPSDLISEPADARE